MRTGEDFGRSLPLQCVPAGLPYVQAKGSQRNKQLINEGGHGCGNVLIQRVPLSGRVMTRLNVRYERRTKQGGSLASLGDKPAAKGC